MIINIDGVENKRENLLDQVKSIGSLSLFKYYCKNFKSLGKKFKSEFREDKSPSCQIDMIKGDLLYSDFGAGLNLHAIDYVKYKYNIGFKDTLKKIAHDFNIGKNSQFANQGFNIRSAEIVDIKEKDLTIIQIKKRDWNEYDKAFWDQYCIKIETLNKFNVVPISHFWINEYMYIADKLAYSYNFYFDLPNRYARKIYQPYSKNHKWYSCGKFVVQGEGMLPKKGDLLIITKSLKDVLTLYELGYTAIAPPSETSWLPSEYFKKQKSRFKKMVIIFDNDETGLNKSKEFSEKWNIPYTLIPIESEEKDISDYIKHYGFDATKQLIERII
jgi:hypothetical protein